MKRYLKPEIELELFEDGDIICNNSPIGEEEPGFEIEWYRPEEEDE